MLERVIDALTILIVGKSGRIDCIADACTRSLHNVVLYAISEVENPGLLEKCKIVKTGERATEDIEMVKAFAREVQPDFVIIGPEEPLSAGVVDALREIGIPCVGPTKSLARIETSKAFTRELLQKYNIPGNPEYMVFRSLTGIREYLLEHPAFVVKPDGLTGGKGVKVFGEHLHSNDAAIQYCEELFDFGHEAVIIEEKLEGEEFSFHSFCDGRHVVDAIPAQDHKRAYEGDSGPNTGGMGSYSCVDHGLPFVAAEHIQEASKINAAVANALLSETGEEYKGILYGGFMLTRNGLRLIEYNARFGDPEVMNILPLLKTDFVDLCEAIVAGTLDTLEVSFERKATVCKYVVPEGYPGDSARDEKVQVENIPRHEHLRVYFGAIDKRDDDYYLIGSRAIALVGIGDSLEQAEQIAEAAAVTIGGPVTHRKDIGTKGLIQDHVNHMQAVMTGSR